MLVRINVMIVRICGVLALILGLFFWFSNLADNLVPVHMLLGILVTLALWVLGVVIGLAKGGSWGLGGGAIVLGIIVIALGLSQQRLLIDPSVHWIIQVLHLLVGLAAIGMGEAIGGRYRRLNPAAQAVR